MSMGGVGPVNSPDRDLAISHADLAIRRGDFDSAWRLLQNVLREFKLRADLPRTEPRQLARVIELLQRMRRESSYDPLDAAIADAYRLAGKKTE